MNPSNKILVKIIHDHQDEMIANTCNRLQKISSSHYEVIDYERHVERELKALDALLKSIETKNCLHFNQYIEDIGTIRFKEGYRLNEVQGALRIFEEELWLLVKKYLAVEQPLIEMLSLCNWIIGEAKDHLAQVYLNKSLETGTQVEVLQEKFFKYITEKKEKENGWTKQE
jgi:hypothetical protein